MLNQIERVTFVSRRTEVGTFRSDGDQLNRTEARIVNTLNIATSKTAAIGTLARRKKARISAAMPPSSSIRINSDSP